VFAAGTSGVSSGLSAVQTTASGVSNTGSAAANLGQSAQNTSNAVSNIGSSGGVVGTANEVSNAAGSAQSTINSANNLKNQATNLTGGNNSNSSSGSSGSSSSGSDDEHKLRITDVPKGQRPNGEDPTKNMEKGSDEYEEARRILQATRSGSSTSTEAARTGIGVASGVLNSRSLPVAQQRYDDAMKKLQEFKGDKNSSTYKKLESEAANARAHYQSLAREAYNGAKETYQNMPGYNKYAKDSNFADNIRYNENRVNNDTKALQNMQNAGTANSENPAFNKLCERYNIDSSKEGAAKQLQNQLNSNKEAIENMKAASDFANEAGGTEVEKPGSTIKAGEPGNDGPDNSKGDGPRDGGYWDPIQSVMVAIMPKYQNQTVDEFKQVIIDAADIGDAMGAIDQTAMNEVGDGVNANTPSSAVAYSVALLQNVPIDVARWIDTKVEEEAAEETTPTPEPEETPTAPTIPTATVISSDITNSGVAPEITPPEPEEEKKEEEETTEEVEEVAQEDKDSYKVEILARRMELARQYANAGVQIAEGMNAISEDFPARAQLLLVQLNAAPDYASAIGALSDIVREDLAETLRATALSSAELGVAASQVLLDSGFVKEDEEEADKPSENSEAEGNENNSSNASGSDSGNDSGSSNNSGSDSGNDSGSSNDSGSDA
jgi:hypothetical protein